MSSISDIKVYLETLSLNPNRMPTIKEYRKAYRELMRLHPDLGGDTNRFQEITLAAREVFEFITKHQGEQTRHDSGTDADLLKAFEASNNISYNTGNIVFDIDPTEADMWVQCLEKRLGKPLPLENGGAVQFKMEEFKIPRQSPSIKTSFGSVTVTVWPKPKTTNPKAMVQGKSYIAFVTFILPDVIKDIKAGAKLALKSGGESLAPESDDELEIDTAGPVAGTGAIVKALARLESEVLNMRNDMADRIDAAKEASDHMKLDKRLESLEGLLREDIEQHAKLTASIDNLRETVGKSEVHLGKEQMEQLASEISSTKNTQVTALHSTVVAIRSDMAQASALTTVQDKVDTMNTLLDQVHSTALKVDSNVNNLKKDINNATEVSNKEMIQMRKNSDDSLKLFQNMMESLKNIEFGNSKTSSTQPSVIHSMSRNGPDRSETPVRKGIMFCLSIAMDVDSKRFKEEVNVDLKVIPTEYIHENPSAQDRDSYLGCMVNQHLRGKAGYSFAIFATGNNDITDLDTDNSPPTTLFSEVSAQSGSLFDIAESVSKELDIDVFIVDKTPRYDVQDDPTGMKQKLTKYSNGVLASRTGATPRIFLVEQASLARAGVKARSDIYQQDGQHLTTRGLNFYTTNIISGLKECYTDTQQLPQQTRERGPVNSAGGAGRDGGVHPHSQSGGRGPGRGNQNGGGRRGRDGRVQGEHNQQFYPPAPPPWASGRGRARWDRDSYWDYPDQRFGGGYRHTRRY